MTLPAFAIIVTLIGCGVAGCQTNSSGWPAALTVPKARDDLPVPRESRPAVASFDVPQGWFISCVGYHPLCRTDYAISPEGGDSSVEITVDGGIAAQRSSRNEEQWHKEHLDAIQSVHDPAVTARKLRTIITGYGPVGIYSYESSNEHRLAAVARLDGGHCWVELNSLVAIGPNSHSAFDALLQSISPL